MSQFVGDLRVVEDVAQEFAMLAAERITTFCSTSRPAGRPFRLACSGGASGIACYEHLAESDDIDWGALACYFVDERCVDPTSSDANRTAIATAFGSRLDDLAGFYPMDCAAGPQAYEQLLRDSGPFDLVQLGFGPDGHTASLFPESTGLNAPEDRLVIQNVDPSGRNKYERLTLTYAGIAYSSEVVVAVVGGEKAPALRDVFSGVDLPATRVRAQRLIWLCDQAAASELPRDLRL